jgi:hypothetical protein
MFEKLESELAPPWRRHTFSGQSMSQLPPTGRHCRSTGWRKCRRGHETAKPPAIGLGLVSRAAAGINHAPPHE